MNKQNEIKIFAQIDELLARWRKEIAGPVSDKPALVEEGIRLFYKKTGKKPPLILWCDSPLQTMLIPTLVSNVLCSEDWKSLVKNMENGAKPNSEKFVSKWNSEWIKVEKNTVLPLLHKIWDFQFKHEKPATQQKVLDRLAEHLLLILKDGRLNAETVLPKNAKKSKSGIYPAPMQFETWKRTAGIAADIERKTTSDFNFSVASGLGIYAGVIDHRAVTKHIPVVNDLLKPSEQQKELLKRVEQIRAKCTELERIATTRAALFTEAAAGFQRPRFVPEINENMDLKKEWQSVLWTTYDGVKKDTEQRLADPRAFGTITWGTTASWLPLALCCRLLDSNLLSGLEDEIDGLAYMFHGAAGYYLGDQVCFVCRHPKTLLTNDAGQPHSANGAAATWSDGFDIHCWRGLLVTQELIAGAKDVKIHQILAEKNAETRRVLLDMFGEERFIQESGATVVHRDHCGTLYRHNFEGDEPLMMVRVRNSTPELDGTYKDYFLRVPPDMRTAKQAVAWTFGLSEDEYKPAHQS